MNKFGITCKFIPNTNAEKNEIMRLVNKHYAKPSFNGKNYTNIIYEN